MPATEAEPIVRNINGKGLTLYPNTMNLQTEEFKDKRLSCKGGIYSVDTYVEDKKKGYYIDPADAVLAKSSKPTGLYLIVVMPHAPHIAYVRKSPFSGNPPKTKDSKVRSQGTGYRGHSSIAIGQDILFGGEVILNAGQLKEWNNNTGHYVVGMHLGIGGDIVAHALNQTQFLKTAENQPLLPKSLFRPYQQHDS